ncbi:putative glycosyltransferase EpsD [subsurface metagenome]
MVPVRSINILSDKIKKLIEDDKLLQEMKIAGRRRAEELYNEKEVVKKQLEIFNKLLNPKKKILFIATVEDHLICFHIPYIKYLQSKGYEVYAATKLGKRKGELEQYGIICHDVNFSRLASPLASLRALMQLIKLMKRNQFSLVHVHTPMASFLGRLAAKVTNIKSVLYTAHGFHFYKGAPWYYWACIYPIEYLLARWTDGLIVINQEDYINAQKMPIRNKGKVYLIPGMGVDTKRYKPIPEEQKIFLRKKYGFKNKDFLLIYTAELNKNKNQYFLIKAISFLKNKIPNLKILFAGDGNLKDDYEKYVQNLNLKDNIVFLGYRQDLEKIIPMCDIGTSASTREGFGINLVEYMSVGLPVVATKNRGHKEIIVDGSNGLLFELGNMTQFIETIERLYKYKSLRKKLGKNAIESAQKFSIERSFNVMSKIYKNFICKVK